MPRASPRSWPAGTTSSSPSCSAETQGAALTSIVVGILTYLRPEGLRRVVDAVLAQAEELDDVTVLVVDNDPAGSALALQAEMPDRVRIVHEQTPGIVAGRNRALDESAGADVLVFIDDDELPSPDWLQLMVGTWEQTRPAAVAGPVVSTFDDDVDPYVLAGRFFVRRRLPTGTDLTVAASGNLLLDVEQVCRAGVRFDERFQLSGGSDSLFTKELHRRGGRMVWCDEALVTDVVPASRANRAWVLRRAVRAGNTTSRVELALARNLVERVRASVVLLGRGLARIVGGTGRMVVGRVSRSLVHEAGGAKTAYRGVGMVGGVLGYTRQEYRRA